MYIFFSELRYGHINYGSAPFIPGDKTLEQLRLPDKAIELITQSAKLTGQLAP